MPIPFLGERMPIWIKILQHYTPVSSLTFIFKLLEENVAERQSLDKYDM